MLLSVTWNSVPAPAYSHTSIIQGTMVWAHCVLLVWMMSLEKHSVLPQAETREVT